MQGILKGEELLIIILNGGRTLIFPIVAYRELIGMRKHKSIALSKISRCYLGVVVLSLKSESDRPVPALAIYAHDLHVLVLIPHVSIVAMKSKHDHFVPYLMCANLIYYVQVLLLNG